MGRRTEEPKTQLITPQSKVYLTFTQENRIESPIVYCNSLYKEKEEFKRINHNRNCIKIEKRFEKRILTI